MTLKYTEETFRVVEYHDLEQFIKEQTGHEYEIACGEECGNDTKIRCDVDGKLGDWDRKAIVEWMAGERESFMLRNILDHLCAEGKLEEGIYLVDVSW